MQVDKFKYLGGGGQPFMITCRTQWRGRKCMQGGVDGNKCWVISDRRKVEWKKWKAYKMVKSSFMFGLEMVQTNRHKSEMEVAEIRT